MGQRMVLVVVFLAACTLLPSCTALRVYKEKTADTFEVEKGVLYYTKVGRLKQTTVLSRTWRVVRLTVSDLENGKKLRPQSVEILYGDMAWSRAGFEAGANAAEVTVAAGLSLSEARHEFVKEATKADLSMAPVTSKEIRAESAADLDTRAAPLRHLYQSLVSNDVAAVTVVDYDTKRYLNTRAPVFGSVSGSIELASDGTLSKASASLDTNALAGELPVAELLSKELSLAAVLAPTTRILDIEVIPQGYLYTLTKYHPFVLAGAGGYQLPPLKTDGTVHLVVRSELKPPAKADPSNTAVISGTVKLPKPESAN